MLLEKDFIDKLNAKGIQSVRNIMHMVHKGEGEQTQWVQVPFAIYFEKGFKKCGWLAEINGKYYGSTSPMEKILKSQMDDIIDVYLALDDQARRSIDKICQS